jgi:hypothetical protein
MGPIVFITYVNITNYMMQKEAFLTRFKELSQYLYWLRKYKRIRGHNGYFTARSQEQHHYLLSCIGVIQKFTKHVIILHNCVFVTLIYIFISDTNILLERPSYGRSWKIRACDIKYLVHGEMFKKETRDALCHISFCYYCESIIKRKFMHRKTLQDL